jgi:hypothetical protein
MSERSVCFFEELELIFILWYTENNNNGGKRQVKSYVLAKNIFQALSWTAIRRNISKSRINNPAPGAELDPQKIARCKPCRLGAATG